MPQFATNAVVDIYRLTVTEGIDEYAETPTFTNVSIAITPVDNQILAVLPGESAYQMYDGYIFSKKLIKNGDKLIDADDSEWIVRGTSYQMGIYLTYTKLLLEKVV